MKNRCLVLIIIFLTMACNMESKEPVVQIQTNYGNIRIKLYNETPMHRDNFLELAEKGVYNNLIFHRVIKDFMIQGGDPNLRTGSDSMFAKEVERDTVPAEIVFPMYIHKKGALAAARWGDGENPTRASDKYQFYIVTGERRSDNELSAIEMQRYERLKQSIYQRLQSVNIDTIKALYRDKNRKEIEKLRSEWLEQAEKEASVQKEGLCYSPEQGKLYKTEGGTPHLDNEYTVFGEVVEGMDVVSKIQEIRTDRNDRPVKEVIIQVVSIEK